MRVLITYQNPNEDSVKYEIVRSVNAFRGKMKFEKFNKTAKVIASERVMRDVYQLYLVGKNKVKRRIDFTTRVELQEKESLTEKEMKDLCDADVLLSKELKHIGYRVDCRCNENGILVITEKQNG